MSESLWALTDRFRAPFPCVSEKQPATIALPYPFNTLAVRVRLIKDDCDTLRKQSATLSRTPNLDHQNFE
jgi:hypothetical protein